MTLELLLKEYAVCRLKEQSLPMGEFVSLTKSGDEVSLVCESEQAPRDSIKETGWRGMRVSGVLDFSLIGILASLTDTLAKAGIPVFVVSTYDTDYLFVKEANLEPAVHALASAGHTITGIND